MDDYKKKYEDALENLRLKMKDFDEITINREDAEEIFPELKESEDELTWLTKYIKEEAYYLSMDIRDNEDRVKLKKLQKALAWLEKQGEQKPKGKSALEAIKEEKIDNQNCVKTDKVEPKFKVGDFILNDYCIGKVIEVKYDAYLLDSGQGIPFSCEHNAHLWTIQDAKDGDVVVNKSDGTIGIFESIGHHPDGGSYNDPSYCFLHCRYDDGFFYADFENGNTMDADDLIPATKEQRDLLFTKMREAGYEWNKEKKELREIWQKSAWSEEDKEMIDKIIDYMQPMPIFFESTKGKSGKEYTKEFVKNATKWLKSLKPQNTWKPSDEQMKILEDLVEDNNQRFFYPTLKSLYNDLKKLKEE